MKSLKSIRLDNDIIAEINARAVRNGRSFSNQAERLILVGLREAASVAKPPVKPDSAQQPKERFCIPSIDEVRDYIAGKGYNFDAEAFVAHYEANGWMRGKNKIKNWKACCTTWAKREDKPTRKQFLTPNEKMAQSLRDSRDPVKAMDF